ncbi:MAG: hypothetical protein KGL39_01090 [Patescibacteria group bacterium]|nr:hypothetical protein [Patescibacteria group bacterium]
MPTREQLLERKRELQALLERTKTKEGLEERTKAVGVQLATLTKEKETTIGVTVGVTLVPGALTRSLWETVTLPVYDMCITIGGSKRTREKYRRRGRKQQLVQIVALAIKRDTPVRIAWLKQKFGEKARANEAKMSELRKRSAELDRTIASLTEELDALAKDPVKYYTIEITKIEQEIEVHIHSGQRHLAKDEEMPQAKEIRQARDAAEKERTENLNEEKHLANENKTLEAMTDIPDDVLVTQVTELEKKLREASAVEYDKYLANAKKHNKESLEARPLSNLARDIESLGSSVIVCHTPISTSERMLQMNEMTKRYKQAVASGTLHLASKDVRENGAALAVFAYSKTQNCIVKLALVKTGHEADNVTKAWASSYAEGNTWDFQYYYKETTFADAARRLGEITKGWNTIDSPNVNVAAQADIEIAGRDT